MTVDLLEALSRRCPEGRDAFVAYLGSETELSPTALARAALAFIEALADEVSANAVDVIVRLAAEEADVDDIADYLERPSAEWRHELMEQVSEHLEARPTLERLAPRLLGRLSAEDDPLVLAEMLHFLGALRYQAATQPVLELLGASGDSLVRTFAVHTLDRLRVPMGVLSRLRTDDDSRVAVAAVQALVGRDEVSWRELAPFVESDDHITAIQAINEISAVTPPAECRDALELLRTRVRGDAPRSVMDAVRRARDALTSREATD